MEADFQVRHFPGDRVVLPPVEDLVDELRDRFLRCQVCTQLYVTEQRGAKVLACGHGLCSPCLQQASTPEGVRCQQCSPARLVSGQPAPDRARVSLMDLVTKRAPDGEETQLDPSVPDTAVSFLADLREQLLTCTICEHAFDCEAHKLVTFSCQHELCSRCARKMERGHSPECPFCRENFRRCSPEVSLPAQLQKWLQPFLPALPSMTSNPEDAFLDRLYSLHDVLEERENELLQEHNRTELLLWSLEDMFAAPHVGQASSPSPTQEALDSKCENFATACMDVIKEALNAETISRPEVWSLLYSALEKTHYFAMTNVCIQKALCDVGAVHLLVQDCWDRFQTTPSPETKKTFFGMLTSIVQSVLTGDEDIHRSLRTNDSFVKTLVLRVKVEDIEDGSTLVALGCIEFMPSMKKDRGKTDLFVKYGLPARCAKVCQAAAANPSCCKSKAAARAAYSVMHSNTYDNLAFSSAVVDAGMLPMLVETCMQLEGSPGQKTPDFFNSALDILDNMSRFPDLHHHLTDHRLVSVLMPLMELANQGLAMVATFALAHFCSEEEDVTTFLQLFHKHGMLARLKSWTEAALASEDRYYIYPGCTGLFIPKDMLACLCCVARRPGQPRKVLSC